MFCLPNLSEKRVVEFKQKLIAHTVQWAKMCVNLVNTHAHLPLENATNMVVKVSKLVTKD